MTAIPILTVTEPECRKIRDLTESHFCDVKAIEIAPSKLTKSLAAFANAEGGELYIGIDEDTSTRERHWRGFKRPEDANGHIQAFDGLFPLGQDCSYEFLKSPSADHVLRIEIRKTRDIKKASNGKVYVRRGPQNLPYESKEHLSALERDKGLSSFETETISFEHSVISNSLEIITFMLQIVPNQEPESWLRKQRLIVYDKPTVAGVVLFADLPQAILPKRSGIKIYRYKTSNQEGTRESLAFDPISVEGCAYKQIRTAVDTTAEIIQSVRIQTEDGLESARYPITALHEIITNAVLHRDYSIADDIHIIIFDNRVEVLSPGTLAGHITPENILTERFSRNATIVWLINKFPDPPNKDIGEGLNTAFREMRAMKLKAPVVKQDHGYVKVTLKHEALATPQEVILEYLKSHDQIVNKKARELCFIESENKMKTIFQKMIKHNMIELVPGTTRYNAAYRLKSTTPRKDSLFE